MRILFINCDGGGFADHLEVQDGLTVGELFQQQLPHGRPADYLIRVNRLPTDAQQVLQPADRVSFTPTKIEGALSTAATRAFCRPRAAVSRVA